MGSKTFWTYRFTGNGKGPAELLQGRIKEAVKDFYQKRKALPEGIVVNPTLEKAAKEATGVLNLFAVHVECIGGCLVNEVWLVVEADLPRENNNGA